ncbi:hypothetical protein R1sor_011415 [Riccia sorocarpa]|uniref:UMP-CMP kinase n=1 Tax=Riccia sorocarpa TaxID=122646 RepID=A0ABD3I6V3_9MARC
MGSRGTNVARTILRSVSHYRESIVRAAAASAANVIKDEVKLARPKSLLVPSSASDKNFLETAQGRARWFYAAAGVMAFSNTTVGSASLSGIADEKAKDSGETDKQTNQPKPRIVFVLGGPGSGKGTQCAKIVNTYGFVHLSAGDLLRAEINSGSSNGNMIQELIKDGKIVPSEVTVKLLLKAMNEAKTDKFLIDGFPRNEENRLAFEKVAGFEPEFILYFDCPLDELEKRLLGRNEGRVDDNIETIRKRFKVFLEASLPVIEYYEKIGKTRKVNGTRPREEVFKAIEPLFRPFLEKPSDDLNETIMEYSTSSTVRE